MSIEAYVLLKTKALQDSTIHITNVNVRNSMSQAVDISNYVQAWLPVLTAYATHAYMVLQDYFFWTQEVLYQILYDIALLYLQRWLTAESCHYVCYGIAFLTTLLVYLRVGLLAMKLFGEGVSWFINLVFTKTSDALVRLLNEILTRVFGTLWYLLLFFPRLFWRALFKKT